MVANALKKTVIVVVVAMVAILAPVGTSVSVWALDAKDYGRYSENRIYFYDYKAAGYCVDAGYSDTKDVDPENIYISGDDNASGVIGTLINNGYSHTAAAAIAGSLLAESGMNPKKLQGGTIVDDSFRAYNSEGKTFNGGFGIAQWTSSGRVKNLQEYADSNNLPVTSIQAQTGFLLKELKQYGMTPEKLNGMDLANATFEIARYYEGPAGMVYDTNNGKYYNDYVPKSLSEVSETSTPAAYKDLQTRYNFAQQSLGITPTDLPEGVMTDNGRVVCIPVGYADSGTPITVDDVIAYLQCDPAYADLKFGAGGVYGTEGASICDAGCGPTSFAILAMALGINTNPIETADIAGKAGQYSPGNGSSWTVTATLADHFGLSSEIISTNNAENISSMLREGKMIHIVGVGSMPYTEGGHYVAIVGMTNDGKWVIGDSGHGKKMAVAAYDPNAVLAGAKHAVAVWK